MPWKDQGTGRTRWEAMKQPLSSTRASVCTRESSEYNCIPPDKVQAYKHSIGRLRPENWTFQTTPGVAGGGGGGGARPPTLKIQLEDQTAFRSISLVLIQQSGLEEGRKGLLQNSDRDQSDTVYVGTAIPTVWAWSFLLPNIETWKTGTQLPQCSCSRGASVFQTEWLNL